MESFLRLDMYVVLVFCGILYANIGVLAVDNYGLLYGVLRTFQAHACDGNELRLNCTRNTVVNINFVRYGREAGRGDLCPGPGTDLAETCRLQNALTIIEEKCRGQMLCRFLIQPETFNEDPCPGVRKYAEVAYKCRPESFVNKIVCDGDWLYLGCPDGHGIAVYSAAFGTTPEGVPECRQTDGIRTEECQVSYATEILMRRCNGQQKCHLLADATTFGDRNCLGRKHLKVAYSCVHRDILKRPTSLPQTPPPEETIHTTSFPGWVRAVDRPLLNSLHEPSTPASNILRSEMQSDEVPMEGGSSRLQLSEERKVVGFMSEWMQAHKYISGNKEKLILYVTLTTGLGLVAFGTVLLGRCLISHVRSRHRPSKLLPVAVTVDDPSFLSDSDVEQFEAELPPPPPPVVVNYSTSLRRQSSGAQPRAPVTDGAEHNEYFS